MATAQLINPDTFLVPHSVTLETLFQTDHFVVPDYQRDFSWTRQEAGDLWRDLKKTANDAFPAPGTAVSNPLPHFIGAIVLQRFQGDSQKSPEVMDGQQRIVTLSILLSVLVEFANSIGDQSIRKNWTRTLEDAVFSHAGGALIPRVFLAREHQHYQDLFCERLTQLDRTAYFSSLSGVTKTSVVYRLKSVSDLFYENITEFLSGVNGPAKDDRLIQLCKSILQLTVALRMSVLEPGAAYDVFETLNDRGLELQQADLLKSKIFSLGDLQGTRAQVVSAWKRIIAAIEGQQLLRSATYTLTDFFFFHYVATYSDIKRTDLYKTVSARLGQPGNQAVTYIEDAARCAEGLQQILESGPTYSSIGRDIEAIRDVFPNKYATTLLMAAARTYGASSQNTFDAIRLTHRFVFRRFIVEAAELSTYSTEIAEIAREVTAGHAPNIGALSGLLKSRSDDAHFKHRFSEYATSDAMVGFYVIEAIENYLGLGAGVVLQRQSPNQHLEHIMPRKLGSGWTHIDPAVHGEFLNRLGNLLVLEGSINKKIRNQEFSLKDINPQNEDYQHSKLELPKGCHAFLDASTGRWTFGSISVRQQKLADTFALAVWALS